MALAPRRMDPLSLLLGRNQQQQQQQTPMPMLDGIDPVAAQGIVRLGLSDPDQFAAVMAATGAPSPKVDDRLPQGQPQPQGQMPEPRRVQTETIRPEQATPDQRVTQGFLDIAGQVQQGDVGPGATAQQTLGDLLQGREPGLVAAPAPGRMLENERMTAPDIPQPPVQMPEVDLTSPVPIKQQVGGVPIPEPIGAETTGTNNASASALGQALLGIKAPDEPRVPPPMPAPAAPRPSQPIQPSATLMSLLLGSLGKGRQTPLKV